MLPVPRRHATVTTIPGGSGKVAVIVGAVNRERGTAPGDHARARPPVDRLRSLHGSEGVAPAAP